MAQFDVSTQQIYFTRFYRGDPDESTTRTPVFDLADAKDRLKDELRERFENHQARGKPPLMADIIDEDGNQLLVARYVAPDRIDVFELNTEMTAVRRVKD
ncbi:MAG TPA: hypothetical protein VHG29_13260 [Novosphingobium sp.]|nr:hypothetical protein [Novosphingobium sp.]